MPKTRLAQIRLAQIPEKFSICFDKFQINGKLACACSGGVDSLAMTIIAAAKFNVVALIIDHAIRPESKLEALKTSEILNELGIENVILSNRKKIESNVQEAARKIRYKLLTDYCKKLKIKYLATAHHADDNAETFLMRLSRGSGVDGLSAINDDIDMNGLRVIRPVLQFTKLELTGFLKEKKIKWVEDPSNFKNDYKRNKLRHGLATLEDKELITKRINEAANNLARVRDFLEIETDKAYVKCVCHSPNLSTVIREMTIDLTKFKKLHDEIAYRLLVKAIMRLSPADKKPRFEKLKRLKTDLLAGKVRTLNGLIFRPLGNIVTIAIEK